MGWLRVRRTGPQRALVTRGFRIGFPTEEVGRLGTFVRYFHTKVHLLIHTRFIRFSLRTSFLLSYLLGGTLLRTYTDLLTACVLAPCKSRFLISYRLLQVYRRPQTTVGRH